MVDKPPPPDPGLASYAESPRSARALDRSHADYDLIYSHDQRRGYSSAGDNPYSTIARGGAICFFVVATAFLLGCALVLVLWFGKQLGVW